MRSKFIKFAGISIFILVISFLIYWAGISAPKKEIVFEVEYIEYSIIEENAKENEENTLFPKVFKENHKKQVGRFKPEKVGKLNRK